MAGTSHKTPQLATVRVKSKSMSTPMGVEENNIQLTGTVPRLDQESETNCNLNLHQTGRNRAEYPIDWGRPSYHQQ